jgi:hypothetical protein
MWYSARSLAALALAGSPLTSMTASTPAVQAVKP